MLTIASLKKHFSRFIKKDLIEHDCKNEVLSQIDLIKKNYSTNFKPQVNPREVNLFFLEEGKRSRIFKTVDGYHIEGSNEIFSIEQIIDKVDKFPENFHQTYSTPTLSRTTTSKCRLFWWTWGVSLLVRIKIIF